MIDSGVAIDNYEDGYAHISSREAIGSVVLRSM